MLRCVALTFRFSKVKVTTYSCPRIDLVVSSHMTLSCRILISHSSPIHIWIETKVSSPLYIYYTKHEHSHTQKRKRVNQNIYLCIYFVENSVGMKEPMRIPAHFQCKKCILEHFEIVATSRRFVYIRVHTYTTHCACYYTLLYHIPILDDDFIRVRTLPYSHAIFYIWVSAGNFSSCVAFLVFGSVVLLACRVSRGIKRYRGHFQCSPSAFLWNTCRLFNCVSAKCVSHCNYTSIFYYFECKCWR